MSFSLLGCSYAPTRALSRDPDFEDQDDLWRGQRPGKAETEQWVPFFMQTEAYLRNLIFKTRVTSGEDRGQAKQKKTDSCLSPILGLTSGA